MKKKKSTFLKLLGFLLCIGLFLSSIGSPELLTRLVQNMISREGENFTFLSSPTPGVTRVSDPNTMNSYKNLILTDSLGSRNAGKMWADKTVFAYGTESTVDNITWKNNTLTLGNKSIGLNTDFLHVFSTIGSGQVIHQYPASPIDLVIILDISSSMGDEIDKDQTDYKDTPDSFVVTRLLEMIDATDATIKALMDQNKENRVSVVVYDNRATLVMPLAHYEANKLPISQIKSDKDGKKVDPVNGSVHSSFVYDDKYLNDGTGKNGSNATEKLQQLHSQLKDKMYYYIAPYFDGHGADNDKHKENYVNVSTFKVVATTKDKDSTGKDLETYTFERRGGTNTHSGIAAGLEQLANATETTYSATLSATGEERTVARIPAAIIMTDGGSNTVSDGQWYNPDWDESTQRSDHVNDWSSVVVLQTLMTASYMKSAVEKNYETFMENFEQGFQIYTVGVDLESKAGDDAWAVARVYPMLDPKNYFKKELTSNDKITSEKDQKLVTQAYSKWEEWIKATSEVTQEFPVVEKSSSSNTFKPRFEQSSSSSNKYTIPFEHETINQSTAQNNGWHGGTKDKEGTFTQEIKGQAVFNQLPTTVDNNSGLGIYAKERVVNGRKVAAVTKEDVVGNINYASEFYNITAVSLKEIFNQVLNKVTSNVFVPIEGNNSAGVSDSITYADPIGLYMEVKNKAISVTGLVEGTENATNNAGSYDMALLLFNEMHGIVRTAVYDADFVSKTNNFESGWYDSTGKKLSDQKQGSWDNGDTYYLDRETALQYIPTLPEETPKTRAGDDINHIKYTIYRFAESNEKRNEEHLNPNYDKEDNITYKLSDIRIWVEDSGNYINQDGMSMPDTGYDQMLYINIPASAIPMLVAKIEEDENGNVISYSTNVGDPEMSLPIRIFYAVGVSDDIMTEDKLDIDVSKVNQEYLKANKKDSIVYFYSNYYSNTSYDGYVTDTQESRTRGDAIFSFSPSPANRYYAYQRPLELYKVKDTDKKGTNGVYEEIDLSDNETFKKFKEERETIKESNNFNANDWYYVILEYYVPNKNEPIYEKENGVENKEKIVGYKGTKKRVAVSRQGKEFGSGLEGDFSSGEFLSWYSPSKHVWEPYSKQKPTYDSSITDWVVATRPGGLRVGDMAQSVIRKTSNTTSTASNTYLPTISSNSTGATSKQESNIIVDSYLGNNGRLAVTDTLLMVAKTVTMEKDSEPFFDANTEFPFQVQIAGLEGDLSFVKLERNPYSMTWQRDISSIDIKTNNQGLLQDSDNTLSIYKKDNKDYYIYIGDDSEGDPYVYGLYNESKELGNRVGTTTYVDNIEELTSTETKEYKLKDNTHSLGLMEFWVSKVYLIPKEEVTNDNWKFQENGHESLTKFVISTLDPNKSGIAEVSSKYATNTTYLTTTLFFGYTDKNKPETKPESWPEEEWNNQKPNTAHFSLKNNEGILLNNISSGAKYSVEEELTEELIKAGFVLDKVSHVQQESSLSYDRNGTMTVDKTMDSSTPTSTFEKEHRRVSGDTGILQEEIYFTNAFEPRDLLVTKTVEGTTSEQEFEFTITITPSQSSATKESYPYQKYDITTKEEKENGTLTFKRNDDGSYSSTVKLKQNETILLQDLPDQSTYQVKEKNLSGWKVKEEQNSTGTITVSHPKEAKFINIQAIEFPESGGKGTFLFYLLGGVLVLVSILLTILRRKKRMKQTI